MATVGSGVGGPAIQVRFRSFLDCEVSCQLEKLMRRKQWIKARVSCRDHQPCRLANLSWADLRETNTNKGGGVLCLCEIISGAVLRSIQARK